MVDMTGIQATKYGHRAQLRRGGVLHSSRHYSGPDSLKLALAARDAIDAEHGPAAPRGGAAGTRGGRIRPDAGARKIVRTYKLKSK